MGAVACISFASAADVAGLRLASRRHFFEVGDVLIVLLRLLQPILWAHPHHVLLPTYEVLSMLRVVKASFRMLVTHQIL